MTAPRLTRRATLAGALATLPLGAARAAYPERPVRWLVGYAAGGGTDILARLLGQAMAARLGQAVVVENRPGAAANLAAEAAAKAAPDGLTVFTAGSETTVLNPAMYRTLPFEPDRDFRLVGLMARFPLVLTVGAKSPSTTARDLVDRAKANPGRIDYGSPGIGSPHRLAMERLARDAGAAFNHVPYRGMAPVLTDLLGGTIEAAVLDLATGADNLKGGTLRPLAVLSAARLPALPEVPTLDEALGLTGFTAYAWQGLVVPAATPEPVAARLRAELAAALAEPDIGRRMAEIGLEPLTGGEAEFRALIDAERKVWVPLIRDLRLALD